MLYVAYAIVAVIVLLLPGYLVQYKDRKYGDMNFIECLIFGWGLVFLVAVLFVTAWGIVWAFVTVGADLFGAKAGA